MRNTNTLKAERIMTLNVYFPVLRDLTARLVWDDFRSSSIRENLSVMQLSFRLKALSLKVIKSKVLSLSISASSPQGYVMEKMEGIDSKEWPRVITCKWGLTGETREWRRDDKREVEWQGLRTQRNHEDVSTECKSTKDPELVGSRFLHTCLFVRSVHA